MRESLHDVRHEVAPRARLEVVLDHEGQERDPLRERLGEKVVGVQVAHRREDRLHLAVEFHLRPALEGVGLLEAAAHEAQPLHRVHRVHRALERQVHVVLLEEDEGLVDERAALGEREVSRCRIHERRKRHRAAELRAHRAVGALEEAEGTAGGGGGVAAFRLAFALGHGSLPCRKVVAAI
jgi:hypothetical protein